MKDYISIRDMEREFAKTAQRERVRQKLKIKVKKADHVTFMGAKILGMCPGGDGKYPEPIWKSYVSHLAGYTGTINPQPNGRGVGLLPQTGSFNLERMVYVNNEQLRLHYSEGDQFVMNDNRLGMRMHHLIDLDKTSLDAHPNGQRWTRPVKVNYIYTLSGDALRELFNSVRGGGSFDHILKMHNPHAQALEVNELLRCSTRGRWVQYTSSGGMSHNMLKGSGPDGKIVDLVNVNVDGFTDEGFRHWSLGEAIYALEKRLRELIGTSHGWGLKIHKLDDSFHCATLRLENAVVYKTTVGHRWSPTIHIYFGNKKGAPTAVNCGLSTQTNQLVMYPMASRFEKTFSHQAYSSKFARIVTDIVAEWINNELTDARHMSRIRAKLRKLDTTQFAVAGGLLGSRYQPNQGRPLWKLMPGNGKALGNTISNVTRVSEQHSNCSAMAMLNRIGNDLVGQMLGNMVYGPREYLKTRHAMSCLLEANWSKVYKAALLTDEAYGKLQRSAIYNPFT